MLRAARNLAGGGKDAYLPNIGKQSFQTIPKLHQDLRVSIDSDYRNLYQIYVVTLLHIQDFAMHEATDI